MCLESRCDGFATGTTLRYINGAQSSLADVAKTGTTLRYTKRGSVVVLRMSRIAVSTPIRASSVSPASHTSRGDGKAFAWQLSRCEVWTAKSAFVDFADGWPRLFVGCIHTRVVMVLLALKERSPEVEKTFIFNIGGERRKGRRYDAMVSGNLPQAFGRQIHDVDFGIPISRQHHGKLPAIRRKDRLPFLGCGGSDLLRLP